jgi:hypothetical protein
MTPCGRCANCRNGAPGICLASSATPPASAPVGGPTRIVARYCRCGEALYGKHQFCPKCRIVRNRETGRLRVRRWSRGLTKNREGTP